MARLTLAAGEVRWYRVQRQTQPSVAFFFNFTVLVLPEVFLEL